MHTKPAKTGIPQDWGKEDEEGDEQPDRAQELCESRSGRPGLPVPNNPYGLCGRKVTLN